MPTVLATLPVDQRTQAGLFFMSTSFGKPPTSVPQQITLLRSRGMVIADEQAAHHFLSHIGYYRLAGYWQVFQKDSVQHIFAANTTIEQVIDLYCFDRELRLLLNDAIERVEVSLRAVLTNEMCCKYGSAWYANEQYSFRKDVFDAIMATVDAELNRTKETFIRHHDLKYGNDDYPPAWKTLQIVSFGTLSKIYGNISNNVPERKTIAKIFGLPSERWLHSWLQVISVLRNYCAHHSRICYRTYLYPPKDMHRPQLPWIKNIPSQLNNHHQQLYYQLCAVRYLLYTCSPASHFNNKFKQLISRYPVADLSRMGFTENWETEDLWKG